jgi:hypothetical protein
MVTLLIYCFASVSLILTFVVLQQIFWTCHSTFTKLLTDNWEGKIIVTNLTIFVIIRHVLRCMSSGAFAKLRKVTISFAYLSVCLFTRNKSAPTRRIFVKFYIEQSKICRENSSFTKFWQELPAFYSKTNINF